MTMSGSPEYGGDGYETSVERHQRILKAGYLDPKEADQLRAEIAKWQQVASQGIAIEHELRVALERKDAEIAKLRNRCGELEALLAEVSRRARRALNPEE